MPSPSVPPQASPIRVFIADDSSDMRLLLRLGIGNEPSFEIVGEASDGEETIRLVDEMQPDVLLLNIAMPKMDGLRVIEVIRAANPRTKIVVLSGFEKRRMQPLAFARGADAYVEKGGRLDDLRGVVASV